MSCCKFVKLISVIPDLNIDIYTTAMEPLTLHNLHNPVSGENYRDDKISKRDDNSSNRDDVISNRDDHIYNRNDQITAAVTAAQEKPREAPHHSRKSKLSTEEGKSKRYDQLSQDSGNDSLNTNTSTGGSRGSADVWLVRKNNRNVNNTDKFLENNDNHIKDNNGNIPVAPILSENKGEFACFWATRKILREKFKV